MLNVITPEGARMSDEMLDFVVGGITDKDKLSVYGYVCNHKNYCGESLEYVCACFRGYYDRNIFKFDGSVDECVDYIKMIYVIC